MSTITTNAATDGQSDLLRRYRRTKSRASLPVRDLVIFGAPTLVGLLGSLVTNNGLRHWYRRLAKPPWTPPDEVFGPVWSVLYLLMGVAAVLIAHARARPDDRHLAEAANATQLFLNFAWTFAFFGRRSVRGGLVMIVLLWPSIILTIAAYARIRPTAAVLLVPYLAWTTFAAALNAEIWRENGHR